MVSDSTFICVLGVWHLLCVYVCAPCQCRSPQRASDPLELEVQMTVEPPGQFWDPNLSDLEGQPVPSLQFQALIDCSLVPEFVWLILSVFQSLVMVISKACRKIGAENDGTFRYARVPLPGNSDVSVRLHLALCGFWWFQVSMPSALSLLSRTTLLLSEETFEETFHLKSRRTHLDQFFSESILLR